MKKDHFWLLIALLVALFVYWPGLSGGYVFDDDTNISDNKKIAIHSLDIQALNAAFWSGDAGPLGRPVSMISFALNHYFTGLDPYWFKLTNVCIHLLNMLLVFWLARRLLSAGNPREDHTVTACLAAALWGLHPLNLTSVLYVVQRMTSLSALFGLLALALYASRRTRPDTFSLGRDSARGLLIALCLVASVFSKESGLLFIPLLIWMELLLFRGEHEGRPILIGRFSLRSWLWGLCALGGLLVLFALPFHVRPESFNHRDFTMLERGLSETRVLFYYLHLFFFPSLSELALYHDDFVISTGLLQPVTTLASLLGLVFITLAGIMAAKRSSLWLFAWGWFLIAHALESTIFSLELVHEHRNYFATIGFAVLIAWLLRQTTSKIRPIAWLFATVFVCLCGFITWQRATLWGNPLSQSAFEAQTHPLSDRANYQLGRDYLQLLTQTRDTHYATLAEAAFRQGMASYKADNGSWFALVHLAYDQGKDPDPELIDTLRRRLHEGPPKNANIGFLAAFADCQLKQNCHMPHHEAIALFASALENPKNNSVARAEISKLLGRYFIESIADMERGEEFLNDALSLNEDVNGHLLMAQVLRQHGKPIQAHEQLEAARKLDRQRVWAAEIAEEEAMQKSGKSPDDS